MRAAASRRTAVGSLRRAFHEARCALEATALADGDAPEVASHQDLGAFTLLLSLQDEDALRLYSDGLLEPIERTEGEYGGELLRSLEAYIEHNGNWERAARQLYCHRHTLRYRIRKVEELTGRDLSRATDRIELWLALRARELVDEAPSRAVPLGAGGTIAPAIVRDLADSDEVAEPAAARPRRGARRAGRVAHGGARRGAAFADARAPADAPASLARALEGCDVLVNSASYRVNLDAMRACLEAGCHYLDLGGLYWMTGRQLELGPRFEAAGLLALLGIGSAPGKTNLMALQARSASCGRPSIRSTSPPPAATSTRRPASASRTRFRRCSTS